MRLFVAAPVPTRVRDRLRAAIADVAGDDRLAWTRPEGWHATLAFVGEVTDPTPVRDATAAAVAAAGTVAVRVSTGAVVTLARRGALAVALHDEPDGALAELGELLQGQLVDAGMAVDRRAIRLHLTLGRARGRRRVPTELLEAIAVPATAWTVDHVEVVQSILGSGPATYATIATVPLGR